MRSRWGSAACAPAAMPAASQSAPATDGKWKVREGRAETVKSTTTRGVHVTVYAPGGRTGSMASGDCSSAGIHAAVRTAAELAAYGDPDPWSTTAPVEESGLAEDPEIDDPAWGEFTPEHGIALLIAGEAAARASDPRITLSDFCSASASRSRWLMASTTGIEVGGSQASAGYSIVAIAQAGGERQMGWKGARRRRWRDLRSPVQIGQEAGGKAVAKFGWRRLSSGTVPVVLDRDSASDFLGLLARSLGGESIYRRQSWCVDRRGSLIASPLVHIVDNPHLRQGLGSRRCDHDGVRSRRVPVIIAGRLEHYLVSGYAARRLGHPYTGHGAGASNLHLQPGAATQDDLVRDAGHGLLVSGWNGWGVDLTAGTFSRGAAASAIENGRLSHPVQEVTLAGRLTDLWAGVRAIGNDPDLEHAVSSPCLRIDGFTVGGG